MKKNIGSTDKIIRIVLGLIFIGLAYFNIVGAVISWAFYVAAAIFIGTSILNFCPLYILFGINTCSTKK